MEKEGVHRLVQIYSEYESRPYSRWLADRVTRWSATLARLGIDPGLLGASKDDKKVKMKKHHG